MERILTLGISLFLALVTTATAQQKKAESKETKIARALSAAPPNIAKAAKVAGELYHVAGRHEWIYLFSGAPWGNWRSSVLREWSRFAMGKRHGGPQAQAHKYGAGH